MRVGIVDVGSCTVRLLVAAWIDGALVPVREERAYVGLGEEIERLGWISEEKTAEAVGFVETYAALAREAGAQLVEVVVTAPGRQSANAEDFVRALAAPGGAAVRVLSAEEEGQLAFEGAVVGTQNLPSTVAVCDVGGGSTEIVVGTPAGGPAWSRSLDVGSLRLTRGFLADDPPAAEAVLAARAHVEGQFDGLTAPLPRAALATGGTARALKKVVGRRLGERELEEGIRRLAKRPSEEIADRYSVVPERARTLLAGALILRESQRRLGVSFNVARTGLREGAALTLLEQAVAA